METLLKSLIGLTVFAAKLSLGLNIAIEQITYLRTRPDLLRRSLLAIDLLVPIVAFLIVILLRVPPGIGIAILLMAASPGAPLTMRKVLKKEGNFAYGASLQITVALLAVVTTPITLGIFFALLPFSFQVPSPFEVAKQVIMAQFIPLGIGILIREKFPNIADKIGKPLSKIADFLLVVITILILVLTFKFILQINLPSLVAIVLMIAASLAIGHFLGGPEPDHRHTLALVTATRNPGLAFLIASLNFPVDKILPHLIPYLLIAAIVEVVYMKKFRNKTENQPKNQE